MTSGRGLSQRGGATEPARYALGELTRRLTNMIRIGTVVDADYDAGKVRVQIGDANDQRTVTRWINWGSERAGQDRTSKSLDIGEQVLLLSPSGRLESAVIVCSLRQNLHPHPSTGPDDVVNLYRILEGTDYWVAMERRALDGDVNPATKKQNASEPLGTMPPQPKVLSSSRELAEALAYVYQHHIRPEMLGVIEHVVMTTQPDAEAFMKLVANCVSSGTATTLVEAGVRGDGDAILVNRAVSGSSTFDTETNPNKEANTSRTGGNALTINETKVVEGAGDATQNDEVAAVQGNATQTDAITATGGKARKVIVIDGDQSELLITLKNTAHVTIVIGEGQRIEADGKRLTLITEEMLVQGKFVKIEADVIVDGNIAASGQISDSVREMSADRDIYNTHDHDVVGHSKAVPTDGQQ